jgi:Meiotically up-regulated gene 113
VIYFASAVGTDLVKIGYCAGDPMKRLRELQTGSSHELILLAALSGSQEDERRIHREFACYRVRGEWFQLPAKLLDDCVQAVYVVASTELWKQHDDLGGVDPVRLWQRDERAFVACAAGV